MSRFFHTTTYLRKILNWTLKGTTAEVGWVQENVQATINQHPLLSTAAAQATIEGDPHQTTKKDGTIDPYHASGTILSKSGSRLTSYHAYQNGVVMFSKAKYNGVNPESSGSSQAGTSSAFKTGLTWQMNQDNTLAEWWDGNTWQPGQWSDEQGRWIAYYKGDWYEWK